MNWIQTFTGKLFYPLDPRAQDIDLRDIAHSLSLQCRFNGHCSAFYSVAEHSVRVSLALPVDLALWGLLHDAAEAYLGDLPRPIKGQMPSYRQAEARLLEVIARHYRLDWPMPEEVAQVDGRLLATEARDIMAPPPAPWELPYEPLEGTIEPWPAARAEQRFIERYHELSASPQ